MAISFVRSTILPIIGTDVDPTIDLLKSKVLLRRCLYCTHCFECMVWRPYRKIKDNYVWKCENKLCTKFKTTLSIRTDSIFENSRIELQMGIYAIYLWSTATPHKVIADRTGINPGKVTELSRCFEIPVKDIFYAIL